MLPSRAPSTHGSPKSRQYRQTSRGRQGTALEPRCAYQKGVLPWFEMATVLEKLRTALESGAAHSDDRLAPFGPLAPPFCRDCGDVRDKIEVAQSALPRTCRWARCEVIATAGHRCSE
jgi:hypothetical protein